MFRPLRMLAASGAALCVALAGCRAAAVRTEARDDFASAYRAAEENKLGPRTFELLSATADGVVEYERRMARLKSAEKEDFARFGAADDPRFVWAHEAECCVHLALAADRTPALDPEAETRKAARRLLRFEQLAVWARLAARREAPRGDAELEGALLALRISTGWPEERILDFDFDSLPQPPEKFPRSAGRSAAECGAELVRATEALLALAVRSPRPGMREIEAAFARVRAARVALAQSYVRRAEKELESRRSEDALGAWRIAAARCELEKVFPGW